MLCNKNGCVFLRKLTKYQLADKATQVPKSIQNKYLLPSKIFKRCATTNFFVVDIL